jgi:class 3 adenylate cyclase
VSSNGNDAAGKPAGPLVGSPLEEVAGEIQRVRLAAELFDPDWNLVWVSDELKNLLGEQDEVAIGYGTHCIEARVNELWSASATEEARLEWSRANLPYVLYETPAEVLAGIELPVLAEELNPEDIVPRPAPAAWSYELLYQRPGFPPMPISCLSVRLNGADGARIGTANAYAPALPATIIDLLARGDERMFERMSRLVEPGRRPAAILFADLQASGTLSRRLPSAVYFRLISALTTAIDGVVVEHGGLVGKHAGDGVTAFFLADDAGSASGAARAAIEAALEIGAAARTAAEELQSSAEAIDAGDVRMNIGLHWGGALYMGQVVTGGRLEVTALGDEVNEGARIQQSARDGAALASKSLLEQLSAEDARAVDIDPDRATYRTIADLPEAAEKSVRDAGGIAVAEIFSSGSA